MIIQGLQIQSTKHFLRILSISLLGMMACQEQSAPTPEPIKTWPHVLKSLLVLKQTEDLVFFKNRLFSGYAVTYDNPSFFTSKTQFINGKKNGKDQKWFNDGSLSYHAEYVNGVLHGKVISWWRNGKKRSESHYLNGVAHGVQMQWYKSGVKFKKISLVNGKEEGLQQSWRENGKLYNNYEVKNGRIFGLKRATLCFELGDEKIQLQSSKISN